MKEKNITKISIDELPKYEDIKDKLKAIEEMTDEEVLERAMNDPECLPRTEEQLENFKPVRSRGGFREGAGRAHRV